MSSSADKQPVDDSVVESSDEVSAAEGAAAAPDDGEVEAETRQVEDPVVSRDELERALAEALRSVEEQHEDVLRVRAEMDNLRKRTAREVENARRHGTEALVEELLPVFDSMERGLEMAGEGDTSRMREGLELVLRMLLQAAAKFGLQPLDPSAEAFDPEYHQAISVREVEGVDTGVVVEVVQKGYRLHDRLVRAAMVIVAK